MGLYVNQAYYLLRQKLKETLFFNNLPESSKNASSAKNISSAKKNIHVVFHFMTNSSFNKDHVWWGGNFIRSAQEQIKRLNYEFNGAHLKWDNKLNINFVINPI